MPPVISAAIVETNARTVVVRIVSRTVVAAIVVRRRRTRPQARLWPALQISLLVIAGLNIPECLWSPVGRERHRRLEPERQYLFWMNNRWVAARQQHTNDSCRCACTRSDSCATTPIGGRARSCPEGGGARNCACIPGT